uniref:Reverse transcriptase n=1 Tax=Cajanus cajan TaxID=3821 RepID=A0A151T8H4_CAJCA|nr:hypothetical protein KK1_017928 [Cajanus cajan]
MQECEMLDLEYFGTSFMWQRHCQGGRLVSQWLDRGICDEKWHCLFPEALMEHLTRKNSDHNPILLVPVRKEDVHHALMSMKSFKTPSRDRFQPFFLKIYWSIVGDDVWHLVQLSILGVLIYGWQRLCWSSFLKGDHSTRLKYLRPIALCNVIYKIITKVLVNRMKGFLPRLGQLISSEVSVDVWKPIHISPRGHSFSHLLFANDVLLFR